MGIDVIAFTVESHGIKAGPFSYETAKQNYRMNDINCPDAEVAEIMTNDLLEVMKEGDSCGGAIEIIAKGVPAGLGEPVFDKLSATIAHGLMSIGGVKGIEFGDGFEVTSKKGSECNDTPYYDEETGRIRFKTNRAGGMLGGISNGEEIRIRVAVKPTPTIIKDQLTVNVATLEPVVHKFASRSDPSLVPRVYSICEAMVRMALVDSIMMSAGVKSVTDMDARWDKL
jgi:chorismate synthase